MVTGTKSKPAASVTIPGDNLIYKYEEGAENTFTVEVKSSYEDKEYSATATISLESKPAIVRFKGLDSYFISDKEGSLEIGWDIENFDRFSDASGNLFELRIMKNGEELPNLPNSPGSESELGSGKYSGSYRLSDISVNANSFDPSGYRDIYNVSIHAKNGSDSTWSNDSFTLHVYDNEALKIMVGEENKDYHTMSNVDSIGAMSQEQILELKRDIHLKNFISANYDEYAWSELADQIKWTVENKPEDGSEKKVVSVNYQQGTLYEDIDVFSYVSYRPTTEFGLSGLSDGSATVTARHQLAGMTDTLDINVETLKDKLYLFQCYPQAETTLTYTNSKGESKSVISDAKGAAAIFEESGINSDVYCSAKIGDGQDENIWLGTFYKDNIETGEGDWTKLEKYPCNNLNLRRAAYAYLYLKNPDGTPYTGDITFRGGVYVNDVYKENAKFSLNSSAAPDLRGDTDQIVNLNSDGRLTVVMDQTQWGLKDGAVLYNDKVNYVFEIAQKGKTNYYPLFAYIDATANQDAFVGSGSAVANFRENADAEKAEKPHIAMQYVKYDSIDSYMDVLETKGNVGIAADRPSGTLTTIVMWWGEETGADKEPKLQLVTGSGIPVSKDSGEYSLAHTAYPFASNSLTTYSVKLNEKSFNKVIKNGEITDLYLDYYADGKTLSRHEALPFRLINLINAGTAKDSSHLSSQVQNMGKAMLGGEKPQKQDFGDKFVNIALDLLSSKDYKTDTSKLFQLRLAPTSDPTKFMGFITANVGGLSGKEQIKGSYLDENNAGKSKSKYMPGIAEAMVLVGKKTPLDYGNKKLKEFEKAKAGKGMRDISFGVGGYAESLIYFNYNTGEWEIQILNGGFHAGLGVEYSWNINTMCGPVPVTATFTAGGSGKVSMDMLTVSYYDKAAESYGIGNDFLTEFRIYLYLRAFAGVGIDYSVVAFKLGIYGQINLDLQFQWLDRPYMNEAQTVVNAADARRDGNLNGQSYKINGQIGLEFLIKFLFISYDKILYSQSFDLFKRTTGDWDGIQESWKVNKEANEDAINALVQTGSMTTRSFGGRQMLALNLAPTLESRDYLYKGRRWDSGGGILRFALDSVSALENLEYNSYPYSNPVVSDDGELVVYISDMDSSKVEKTRAAFATKKSNGFYQMGNGGSNESVPINDKGYGDSQLALSGTKDFAVASWTRQMETINKDAGSTITPEDQMIMINSTDVFASIYNGSDWITTQLSNNSSPDLAPVAATNGERAIVAWRSVSASGEAVGEAGNETAGVTTFDQKDTIVYKIYDGGSWSDAKTLYNGTSGGVKAIVAAMLEDGTAAVAYTLDIDENDNTSSDREIAYNVIPKEFGSDGTGEADDKVFYVRATNDNILDENPQLTAVKFGEDERFVLAWYTAKTEEGLASEISEEEQSNTRQTSSDIRLLEFGAEGTSKQLMPDSIGIVADAYNVNITPNFRFTKNSNSINDLSILWVERAEGSLEEPDGTESADRAERDLLKGIKFYTYGENDERISFTGAIDVAEMKDSTLIDHFDAYVSNSETNEVKALILASTYGEDGVVTHTSETINGELVSYDIPSRTTSMYTATETYKNKIEVEPLYVDYSTIRKGAETQIQFSIENRGIHAINEIEIDLKGQKTIYGADGELNLLPGDTISLYADYMVPQDKVVDPEYTVRAGFNPNVGSNGSGGNSVAIASGTVYLNLPDIAITDAAVVNEEDGERTIQIKLNNGADADLNIDEHKIELSFFADMANENPISDLESIIIEDKEDLDMINEGGYSVQKTFDVGEYVKGEDGEVKEIPKGGVKVYIRVDVLDKKNEDEVQGDPNIANNSAYVTCDNLKERTGQDVTMTNDFAVENGVSTVTVSLQNNRLTETSNGNLIVTLQDRYGNALESKQSYTGIGTDKGLIKLEGEEKKTQTFTFSQAGASVQVAYTDVILDNDKANLSNLRFSGIPGVTLENFVKDEDASTANNEVYTHNVRMKDLLSTSVMADADSTAAKVYVEGQGGELSNILSSNLRLRLGENRIKIVVESGNGSVTKTYILTVSVYSDPVYEQNSVSVTGTEVAYDGKPHGLTSVTAAKENSLLYYSIDGGETWSEDPPTFILPGRYTVWVYATNPNYEDTAVVTADVVIYGDSIEEKDRNIFSPGVMDIVINSHDTYTEPRKTEQPCDGGPECPSRAFTDLDINAWYHESVDFVLKNKLMVGTSDKTFEPNTPVSRAMLVTILWRLEGQPSVNYTMDFEDVSAGEWYTDAIRWAASKGLVKGYDNGKFGAKDNMTREQMVTILHRYASYKGYDVNKSQAISGFSDAENISEYALPSIRWALAEGILKGYDDGNIGPKDSTSRAQIAAVIERFLKSYGETN